MRRSASVGPLLAALLLAAGAQAASDGPPRLLYVGATATSSHDLFTGDFTVEHARAGGEAYATGGGPVPDLAECALGGFRVVFLDADVGPTINSAHGAALGTYVTEGGSLIFEWTPEIAAVLGALSPLQPGGLAARPGARVVAGDSGHPALLGIPYEAWTVTQEVPPASAAAGARVLLALEKTAAPLVAIGDQGQGKVVALNLRHAPCAEYDRAGALVTPGFDARAMPCYDKFIRALALLMAGAGMEKVAPVAYDAALGYWMTACFPIGYAKYRFDLRQDPWTKQYELAEIELRSERRLLGEGDTAGAQAHITKGLQAALAAAAGANQVWEAIPADAAQRASARREILCCPGTLDLVHTMNLSQSPMGAANYWLATSARTLVTHDPAKDTPPGQTLSFWRGLHPLAFGQPVLPTETVAERMWQRGPGGQALAGGSRDEWLNPAVRALDVQLLQFATDGLIINKSAGQGWEATGGSPEGGYGEFAARAFREYLRSVGETPQSLGAKSWDKVLPPTAWEPTRLWLHFVRFRDLYAAERHKGEYWAVKMRAARAVVGSQAEGLNDPLRRGLCGNAGRYVENLQPALFSGWGPGVDPAEVEIAAASLCSMCDLDKDGAPDNFPGFAVKFAWDDPLAMPPEQHRSLALIALMRGAKGILESWAGAPDIPDATAVWPSRVYERWDAAFEPAVRHSDLFATGKPVQPEVALWYSTDSLMMSQPGVALDRAAQDAPREWAKLVIQAGYTPHFVYDDDVLAGRLLRFRALVVPAVLCVSEAQVTAISQFVQAGGVVIVAAGSGAFGPYHAPRAFAFGGLCGIKTGTPQVTDAKPTLAVADAKALPGVKNIGGGAIEHPITAVDKDTSVVAKASDGKPGLTVRTVGKGRAAFVSVGLPPTGGDNALAITRLLQAANVHPYAYAELPPNAPGQPIRLLGYRGADPKVQYVAVVNYAMPNAQQAVQGVTVSVAVQDGRYDVKRFSADRPFVRNDPAGEVIAHSVKNGRLTFKTDLPAFGAALFEVRRK
jgi:hypothetical protein